MITHKTTYLISFIATCIINTSTLAQTDTLNDCINYAYANRSELQKQENAHSRYKKQQTYAKYNLLPTLQAEADHRFVKDNYYYSSVDGYLADESYQLGQLSLSGKLDLFSGGATLNNIKQSKLLLAKNKSDIQVIQNSIKLEVIQIYFSVLLAKENIEVVKNALTITKQQIETVTIYVEEGKQSKVDLLELEDQSEKENSELISAQKEYDQAIIKLKQAINFKEEALEVEDVLQDWSISAIDADSIYLTAISFLPEFEQIRYDSLYWNYAIKQVKAGYLPYLSTSFSLSTGYQNNDIDLTGGTIDRSYKTSKQLDDNFSQQLGISLVIPLYSRHQVKQQIIEKEQQLQDISVDKAQLYQDIYFEIEQLCNTTVRCQENYKTIEKRLEYCSEIYEMRKEQFQHGVLSITDYLIAENKRKNVELLLTYEKYNLLLNLKLIDHYLGK